MLVLDNIFCVMMVVSEGGESSQMTLTRYFVNLHKKTLVYRSVWLSSKYTAIRKTTVIGHFSAVTFCLGVGRFGCPAMAAVNARKMKYALLVGAVSETGIHDFLR